MKKSGKVHPNGLNEYEKGGRGKLTRYAHSQQNSSNKMLASPMGMNSMEETSANVGR